MAQRWHQKPGRRSRIPSLATAPANHRQLTPAEVRSERLYLAVDMLRLLVADGVALPSEVQDSLRILHRDLCRIVDEVCLLP